MKIARFAALLCILFFCLKPVAATAKTYQVSVDGAEVTDLQTGLIWRRCSEYMSWDGATCAGSPIAMTQEAALQRAAEQASTTGKAWRLPNFNELSSITDKTRYGPAVDTVAFPNSVSSFYWSATPSIGMPTGAFKVNFTNGGGGADLRSKVNSVRLVRGPDQ